MKWTYVSRGHYSTPSTGGWTTHVLTSGIVYKTHPTRKTVDVTGAKAEVCAASLGGKMRTKSKRVTKKAPTKTKPKKLTKRQIKKTAKKLAAGAGKVLGTMRAFTTQIGEEEEAAYKRRAAPPARKRLVKPKRRCEPTLEEWMGW